MILRYLLLASSAAHIVIAIWLVGVVFLLLPEGNAEDMPFWSLVALGYLLFALGTLLHLHGWGKALVRPALLFGSLAGLGVGAYAVTYQFIRVSRVEDFEGYIVVMGAALIGHSILVLSHLLTHEQSAEA